MSFFLQLEEPHSLNELAVFFNSPPSFVEGISDEDAPLWYEEVAIDIAKTGRAGVEFLLQHIENTDELRLRAILAALSWASEPVRQEMGEVIVRILRSFLHDERPLVVAEAVSSLTYIGYAEAKEDILPLLLHPSRYVVGRALHFASKHAPDIARRSILDFLRSSDPIIKQAAIDEADELGYVVVLPGIRQLLTDSDEYVRQAAATAVENLSDLEKEGKQRGRI